MNAQRQMTVAAVLGLLVFAGCGSDDGASGSTAPTSATAVSTTAVETTAAETTTVETTTVETTTAMSDTIPTGANAYATAFVDAWASGDRATAERLGTADAVETIFSREGGGDWQLEQCDGAAGSSYCTFSAGGDPTVIVRVMNEAAQQAQPQAVAEVRFEG